jgi:hypothetical protein
MIGYSKRRPALYMTVRRDNKPTVILPFWGDQPFWGDMIALAGTGAPPIPYKRLTVDKLAPAIKEALQPVTATRAAELDSRIKQESGVSLGVTSFHDQLPMDQMRCVIVPEQVAVWRLSAMIVFL